MKKVVNLSLFLLLWVLGFGLSGYGESSLTTLDLVNPAVNLVVPDGGEQWYACGTYGINWNVSDTNLSSNPISLFYSLNSGLDYAPISDFIENTGIYNWTLPVVMSDYTLVRITTSDSYGNQASDVSASPFSIIPVAPAAPQNVSISSPNNQDAVITWQAVNQTQYGTLMSPDGYYIMAGSDPDESSQPFGFLDVTTNVTYTHQYSLNSYPFMFYRVVAFKNYPGRRVFSSDNLAIGTGK